MAYGDYEAGKIFIKACEGVSSERRPDGTVTATTPGECVSETALDRPAAFSMTATISWAKGHETEIELIAYLVESGEDSINQCVAGAREYLEVKDHNGIQLSLRENSCPFRD